jgi:hypothetical protein
MPRDEWLPEIDENGEIRTFYDELQTDLLDTAYYEKQDKPTKSDIWEIVIREGLYQNLIENPSVAIGFLLTSIHGPTSKYKQYLDLANDHSGVVVLIALSALVNDTVHRMDDHLNDRITSHRDVSKNSLGNISDLSYIDKKELISKMRFQRNGTVSDFELIVATAPISNSSGLYDTLLFEIIIGTTPIFNIGGLYDNPPIDYLSTDENIKFVFKAQKHGYSIGEKDNRIDPTGDGRTYHIITEKRLLTVVGRKYDYDKILSIPISSIKKVEVHTGWTKDRIQLNTKSRDNDGPYHIWVQDIHRDDKSAILAHLGG